MMQPSAQDAPQVVEHYHVIDALDLIDLLDPVRGAMTNGYYFRGHGDSRWRLEASLFREAERLGRFASIYNSGTRDREDTFELDLLLNFVVEADQRGFEIPGGGDEVIKFLNHISQEGAPHYWASSDIVRPALALAQHSGIPTRLLDWTRNSFAALYFAARDSVRMPVPQPDLCVWAIPLDEIRAPPIESKIPHPGVAGILKCSLNIDFLQIGGAGNPNLRAQHGELLYPDFRLERLMSYEGEASPYGYTYDFLPRSLDKLLTLMLTNQQDPGKAKFKGLKKITLPASESPRLLAYLDAFGFHGGTIYPGLSGVADSAKERTQYQNLSAVTSKSKLERNMQSIQKLLSAWQGNDLPET